MTMVGTALRAFARLRSRRNFRFAPWRQLE
jgi:hypothetical protein